MDCGKSWRALAVPPKKKFLTILRQLHEGQQGQVKHNGSLSGSFPISNGVKQGCILALTLFSIFLSIMLREAKDDLPDGTKTIEELITELLFADDCALLAHTEEALQHIVNRFSDAAKNFGLTISLKKIEVLYQAPLREAYSPPHISIDGTNLNAVEHLPG